MRFIAIMIMALLASGCSQVVTQAELAAIEEYCTHRGGVYSYSVWVGTSSDIVHCRNGDWSRIVDL
jgi:uncharacterized protein YceK